MKNASYILATPAKNEAENLPNLIKAILAQSIKPVLWVIIDDGSTDGTAKIISLLEREHSWIKGLNFDEGAEYMGKNYPFICNKGFDFAVGYCKKNKIKYDYIGLVDADNIPEKEYFEKLVKEFEIDIKLGIASGINAYVDIHKILFELRKDAPDLDVMDDEVWALYGLDPMQIQPSYEDRPMGSARLWRKKCFEETGNGYPIGFAPDSVSNIKAYLKGWKTKRFRHAKIIERTGNVKQGLWGGGARVGKFDYFLGRPLYYAFLRSFKLSVGYSPLFGFAHFYGYLNHMVNREERVSDPEVFEYYKSTRIHELRNNFFQRIKKRLKSFGARI